MTGYDYTVPQAKIHGIALRIQNTGASVSGIYSDAGIFLDDGENRFPLLTCGKSEIVTIPDNATIWIYERFDTPIRFRESSRLQIDSTSIPETCIMQPTLLLEMED